MDVYFKTESLALLLGNDRNRVREFGSDGAAKIDLRLQQLASAPTLEEMKVMPGRCRELNPHPAGFFTIDVLPHCQLTFHPSGLDGYKQPRIGREWNSIDSITVSDYQRLSTRGQL
ncbi:hypothetical protein [Arthrobacter sp. HLT1-21]